MRLYTKYQVGNEERFDFMHYPKVVDEITQIKMDSATVLSVHKADILISYTKNHNLNLEWIAANPRFTELVTSGVLSVSHVEALFEASNKNAFFQQQFVQFLISKFE